jgi:benzoyl-CoA reductase/2-hydroxyglutaryl-CoA dehydratase subunit BcrC/BadD/HgdB
MNISSIPDGGFMCVLETNTAGYACCYVPVEIILAAGLRAERIIPGSRSNDADGYAHPNTCCYARSLLADGMSGLLPRLETVILANSCDGMRKIFDLWNGYVDRPGALFLDIPKKQGPDAEACFSSALKRLGGQISRLPRGKPITSIGLKESIQQMNIIRSRYRVLFDAQKKGMITGSDVFPYITDNVPADKISVGLQKQPAAKKEKKIVITGNMLNNQALVSMIESGGGAVIGFDTCFGMRQYQLPVDEGYPDPWRALARRYLSGPQCPRMMGVAGQLGYLKNLIADMKPDGMIVNKVKFCDNLSFNIPQIEKEMKSAGIGCLVLENDYAWSDAEKMRIKVETFLEMMK